MNDQLAFSKRKKKGIENSELATDHVSEREKIDLEVPACYYRKCHLREKIHHIHFNNMLF